MTVLAYFAYARFVLKSGIFSTAHGFTVKNTPYSEPLAVAERKALHARYRKDAFTYFEGVKLYIERHPEDYPAWICTPGCDSKALRSSRFSVID